MLRKKSDHGSSWAKTMTGHSLGQAGFSMTEMLVATALTGMIAVGAMKAFSNFQAASNNRKAKEEAVAMTQVLRNRLTKDLQQRMLTAGAPYPAGIGYKVCSSSTQDEASCSSASCPSDGAGGVVCEAIWIAKRTSTSSATGFGVHYRTECVDAKGDFDYNAILDRCNPCGQGEMPVVRLTYNSDSPTTLEFPSSGMGTMFNSAIASSMCISVQAAGLVVELMTAVLRPDQQALERKITRFSLSPDNISDAEVLP